MDVQKLLTDAVTDLILTQSLGIVNDITVFLHDVERFSRDVNSKELHADLCKQDITEILKSALSYVDRVDCLYQSGQNIHTMAKIQIGLKFNDSRPLAMFLSSHH